MDDKIWRQSHERYHSDCTVEIGGFAPFDARKKGQKNDRQKPGGKYIESKHLCMVNEAKQRRGKKTRFRLYYKNGS